MAEESRIEDVDQGQSARIDVKEAVRRAKAFLLDLYENEDLYNVRLEEVELSDDGRFWLVTIGFAGFRDEEGITGSGLFPRSQRVYKRVVVDAYTGKAESMKIREL